MCVGWNGAHMLSGAHLWCTDLPSLCFIVVGPLTLTPWWKMLLLPLMVLFTSITPMLRVTFSPLLCRQEGICGDPHVYIISESACSHFVSERMSKPYLHSPKNLLSLASWASTNRWESNNEPLMFLFCSCKHMLLSALLTKAEVISPLHAVSLLLVLYLRLFGLQ